MGSFDHVWILMTCSMSTVSTYASQENEIEAQISIQLGFLKYSTWTRLPANVSMPYALETRPITVSWLP